MQPHARAHGEERQERAPRRLRQLQPDGGEHLAQDGEPLVDASGAQQLIGGEPLELGGLVGGRERGAGEEGVGRFGAAAALHERVAERDVERVRIRRQLEREPIEARGAIEREGVARLCRRVDEVAAGAAGLARFAKVRGDALGVGAVGAHQRQRQPLVGAPPPLAVERDDDSLAHAIVIRLDEIRRQRAAGAAQARGAQLRGGIGEAVGVHLGGGGRDLLRQRSAGERDQLDDAARRHGQLAEPRAQGVLEAHRVVASVRQAVAHQHVDEQRMAAGGVNDGAHVDRLRSAGGELGRQLHRVVAGERTERQPPHVAEPLDERAHRRVGVVAGGAHGGQQHQPRRVRPAQQLGEEHAGCRRRSTADRRWRR